MEQRKYEIMEAHLKGDLTVLDLIDRIVELEQIGKEEHKKAFLNDVKIAYEVKDYIMVNCSDAQDALTKLMEYANRYSIVSVADYYGALGIQSMYVDNAYGWSAENIKNAYIVRGHGGWMIKFPQVEVL